MKKIFLILLMLTTLPANADIILKYGMVAISKAEEPNTLTWAGIWAETDNCKHCMALFALETYGESEYNIQTRMVGTDFVFRAIENNDGALKFNLGFGIAESPLNGGENFNFHYGFSMVAKKVIFNQDLIFSYDHFSNGQTVLNRDHIAKNVPLNLVSIGIGF